MSAYSMADFTDDYGILQAFCRLVDPDGLTAKMPVSVGTLKRVVWYFEEGRSVL